MRLAVHAVSMLVAMLALAFAMGVGPASAQPASGSNPTAESVHEQQLLQELNRLQGRISIPNAQLAVLEQPQGRGYRAFHEGALPWIGGIVILGMLAALAVFYFMRGRISIPPDAYSGRKILRYNAFERLTHWMTATSFVVLAITGLNYVFGKRLLMPLLGADAFAGWSQWAKYAHNFIAWPFMLGVLFMIALWVKDNLPDRYDAAWLKAGGGFFGEGQPNAGRFNAGQKLVFWSVVIFGVALSVSGLMLLFPFSIADINGMQWAQYVHSIVGAMLIAIILAHIYIGTLGTEGAFEAMESGEVDRGWALHHHRAWVEAEEAEARRSREIGRGTAAPAE